MNTTNPHNESNSLNVSPEFPSVLCSRIECQSYKDEQNLSDLKEFLSGQQLKKENEKRASKEAEKRASDLKKMSNFHRPSKSLTDAVITKFALKDNPRFFEPLLKAKDPKITSPPANINTFDEILKEKNSKKKGSTLLQKSMTTPEKRTRDHENPSLTRNDDTAKLHIVSPVPYRQDNEFLEQSSEMSEPENEPEPEKNKNEIKENPQKKKNNFNNQRKTVKEIPNKNQNANDFAKRKSEKVNVVPPSTERIERKSFGSLKDEMKRMELQMKKDLNNVENIMNKEAKKSDSQINQNAGNLNGENPSSKEKEAKPKENIDENKKNKRVSLEEKLDEKFRKLAEEKKQRNFSVFVKTPDSQQSKALKIDDFLDQKFKELRLKKIEEKSLPISEAQTLNSEQSENIPQKQNQDLEPKLIQEKKTITNNPKQETFQIVKEEVKINNSRKSMKLPPPSSNPTLLLDAKKRAQSTILPLKNLPIPIKSPILLNQGLPLASNQNEKNNDNPKPLFISDENDHDRKLLEEKKLLTPTFEQVLESSKISQTTQKTSVDINDNQEIEDIANKIIIKMTESGEYHQIDSAPKKKSNLKSSSIFSRNKSRSRSVAFKVKDFAQILEFDEAENPQSLQNSCIEKEELKGSLNNSPKEEALTYSIKPEVVDETILKEQNESAHTENLNEQTMNIDPFTIKQEDVTVEVVTKKPLKNRSQSVNPQRLFSSPQREKNENEDSGFRSSDEIYNPKNRSKTMTLPFNQSQILNTPEKIVELSNENSPISIAKKEGIPKEIYEEKENLSRGKTDVVEKNEEGVKNKMSLSPSTSKDRKSRLSNKRPSSVQYIPDDDFYSKLISGDNPAVNDDDSSGDDKSSEESDTRKIFSENVIDLKEKKPETLSKFKKLIKKKEEEDSEKELSIDIEIPSKDITNNDISQENNVNYPKNHEEGSVESYSKNEREMHVKSFFEAKKSLQNPKGQKKTNGKSKKNEEKEKIAKQIIKIEQELAEETKKVNEIRDFSMKKQRTLEKRPLKKKVKVTKKKEQAEKTEKKEISPLFDNEDKNLMEEILLYETKLQEIIAKINLKTFLVFFLIADVKIIFKLIISG